MTDSRIKPNSIMGYVQEKFLILQEMQDDWWVSMSSHNTLQEAILNRAKHDTYHWKIYDQVNGLFLEETKDKVDWINDGF